MEMHENVQLTFEELIMLTGMVTGQRLAMQHIANEEKHQQVLEALHIKLSKATVSLADRLPLKGELANGDR